MSPEDPEPQTISDALSAFMRGVKRYNGDTYGGDEGAYGITRDRWDTMALGAGLQGANMGDHAAQDYVAAYWMNKWYDKFQNWNLVAVAWTSGVGAANEVVYATNKDPRAVSLDDIKNILPESHKFTATVMKDAVRLGLKGWEEGIDQYQPLTGPSTVIVGTGNAQPQDAFSATVMELRREQLEKQKSAQPSGAEMLFAQLEGLSNVVTGGEGRVDWRSDYDEAGSGGNIQKLDPIAQPTEMREAR